MRLTASQEKALDLRRRIAVTASAGSGKTRVLVERYVRILETRPDLDPARILAITFTNKAAAQMRERVREEVNRRLAECPEEQARWAAVRDALPDASVSTIDSFCSALLRRFPIEAGVDPAFEMVENADAASLLAEAVDATMERLAERPEGEPGRDALWTAVHGWGRYQLKKILIQLVRTRGVVRDCLLRVREASEEEALQQIEESQAAWRRDVLDLAKRDPVWLGLMNELEEASPGPPYDDDPGDKMNAARLHALAAWEEFLAEDSPDRASERLRALADLSLRGGSKKRWPSGELERCKDALKRIRKRAGEALQGFEPPGEVDRQAARLTRALAELFVECERAYWERKGAGARLDFADVEERALLLLQSDRGGARAWARKQFAFVLVDEFQDTNRLQWAIIEQIVGDAEDKLFVVGDPKQSIYAFRGAEVEVFNAVKHAAVREPNQRAGKDQTPFEDPAGEPLESSLEERLGDLRMAENFRSRRMVVDFINALFGRLMTEGTEWGPAYEPLRFARDDSDPGAVELLIAPDAEPDLLAARLRALVDAGDTLVFDLKTGERRPAEFRDIVILLRSRTRLAEFEDALRARGVPFDVVAGVGFYERREVLDIVNVLRFLSNQDDDIALAAALRSPLFGVSDAGLLHISQRRGERFWDKLAAFLREPADADEEDVAAAAFALDTLSRWLDVSPRLPCSELIRRIAEDTGFWAMLAAGPRGEQDCANIEKLILAAQEFQGRGLVSLADLAERLDRLRGEQEGEAPLETEGEGARLMTVHAAKGLEAPIVAAADLARQFHSGAEDPVYVDRNLGIGVKAPNPEENYEMQSSALRSLIGKARAAKALAEEKRLFYVACTRARDMLILSWETRGKNNKKSKSCADWIQSVFPIDDQQTALTIEQEGGSWEIPIHRDASAFEPPGAAPAGEPAWTRAAASAPASDADRAAYDALRERLEPALPAKDARRFSPTELMLFRQCPMRHYLSYELGVSEETAALEDRGAAAYHHAGRMQAILRGQAVHRLFELLDPRRENEDADLARIVLNEFEQLDAAERAALAEEMTRLAKRFRRSRPGRRALAARQARNEAAFALRIGEAVVEGQIDKLFRGDDGRWVVLDYKTNEIGPEALAETAEKYELQLQIYALAAARLVDAEPPIEAMLYFTALDDVWVRRYGEADLEAIERETAALIREVDAFDASAAPEPRDECRSCGYSAAGLCRPRPRGAEPFSG